MSSHVTSDTMFSLKVDTEALLRRHARAYRSEISIRVLNECVAISVGGYAGDAVEYKIARVNRTISLEAHRCCADRVQWAVDFFH